MNKPNPVKLNLFDKAISVVNPEKGLRRLQARHALSALGALGGRVSRTGGGYSGTLSSWRPKILTARGEARERELIARRAADLVGSNAHAASLVDGLLNNSVGIGLRPQALPQHKILGITQEQASDVAAQAEWAWKIWGRSAGADGSSIMNIQRRAFWSAMVYGEHLSLPLMLKPAERQKLGLDFALALRLLDPVRLQTPPGKAGDGKIRDGIELDQHGRPLFYHLADPQGANALLNADDFRPVPARKGHRPNVLHGYITNEPERPRGVSVIAPALKAFRDLADYLDFELVGAIVAANFPMFIESANPYETGRNFKKPGTGSETTPAHQEAEPGQILYGRPGEKPHILKNERPGNTFEAFVELLLRSVGAAAGMPYEVLAKDFSKTNYSSARAALLEAWRVFITHRTWLVETLCLPLYEMVFEEAFLRGTITLPQAAPDFYDNRAAWTNAIWIGPARGHIDPLKEMRANIAGLNEDIITLADISGEQGRDWETQISQRQRERDLQNQGQPAPENTPASTITPGSDPAQPKGKLK